MKNNSVRPTGLKGNDQVNRMRSLMGMAPIHENVKRSVVELIKKGPDGRIYGIVRENHEYYIKIANNKPNLIAEDFKYIGGLKNKKEVVYESYSKAIKQLNLKFISLNEARGIKGETNTFLNDKEVIAESFDAYPEKPGAFDSRANVALGTVSEPGKNDGHDKEIINDAGETGNPDVSKPPVVEDDVVEGEAIEEESIEEGNEVDESTDAEKEERRSKEAKVQKDMDFKNGYNDYVKAKEAKNEEVELTENEWRIDKMIIETRGPKVKKTVESIVERRLSIEVALNNISEGINSQKKK